MIPFWIKPALILLALAGLAYGFNALLNKEQQIGYDRAMLEVSQKENESLKFALTEITRLNNKVTEAQNAAKERELESQKYVARISALDGKLRDSQRALGASIATASTDALRNTAHAFNTLFAECRDAYAEMGKAASGHYSDVVTLEQSWPTR